MIKYSKFYKKEYTYCKSFNHFTKLITLFLSSILLSLFVCFYPPIQGEPTFMVFYVPIFFVYYFVFAVPLQLLFSLQPKAFHPLYLAAYLLIAMVVMLFVIDGIGSSVSIPIVIMSSLIYWIFDSLLYQRTYEKNT
ncbi:UPF0715 family protein [Bacillus pumilus]|nr:UPF0715 family protein [Bacillus pumilus]MCY7538780.1 UPF0715 family protein [Bacillus pumilus]MEC3593079.1 UPF0715 family protein [Bacillus pumilus]